VKGEGKKSEKREKSEGERRVKEERKERRRRVKSGEAVLLLARLCRCLVSAYSCVAAGSALSLPA
jgi:hypothetical protein